MDATRGAAPAAAEIEFEVCIASTGVVLGVAPDRSILDVLREAGIDMPSSCEVGVCGTCVTRVVAGRPDHQDMYLTEEERGRNDQFTPCCSRSLSPRLVLDL